MGVDQAKLSVALCTYNGGRFLADQLQSIARQTIAPDEVVICDDGSTDDTAEIVAAFAGQAPFGVRWERNASNLGSTKNFENAISLCEGDLIFLADQDDVWRDDKLARFAAAFRQYPEAALAFSNAAIVDEELRPLGYQLWDAVGLRRPPGSDATFQLDLFPETVRTFVVTGATMAIRRQFRDILIPFRSEWVHDGWIATLLSGIRPAIAIDEALIQYRQHTSQQVGLVKPIRRTWDIRPTLREGWRLWGESRSPEQNVGKYTGPEAIAAQYGAILDRLDSCGDAFCENQEALDDRRELLRCKLEHLQRRADIRKAIWRRPVQLWGEWRRGGYSRFSNGTLTALRDLAGI
ncbi:glycosyltransferase family 2 protein [Blastopirellula marina]|uniref:glycosyltransferase family 2 protein n=1 Tax=Blastopirellula marina TaxID=124 RepID=UPI001304980A|nr:glycosyltransferase family 2 protein [Blastopirellula marina]